jgi:hypothetical protein
MGEGGACTLRTRKMMKNPLLARRQMVSVDGGGRRRRVWAGAGRRAGAAIGGGAPVCGAGPRRTGVESWATATTPRACLMRLSTQWARCLAPPPGRQALAARRPLSL